MRTDQQYTGAFARNLSGDKLRDGTVWREHYMAWTSGSAELDRFNMLTETQSTVGIGAPAGSTADAWGMSWENEGMFTRNNDGTLFDFDYRNIWHMGRNIPKCTSPTKVNEQQT